MLQYKVPVRTTCSVLICISEVSKRLDCTTYYPLNIDVGTCQTLWIVIGDLKQNSQGWRRQCWQNNKTNYRTSEIKVTFVPSCSQMRLQLLHFHTVFKTWSTCQELTSVVAFRRRRWSQQNFSKNRNIHGKQSKYMLRKIWGSRRNISLASRCCRCHPLKDRPYSKHSNISPMRKSPSEL